MRGAKYERLGSNAQVDQEEALKEGTTSRGSTRLHVTTPTPSQTLETHLAHMLTKAQENVQRLGSLQTTIGTTSRATAIAEGQTTLAMLHYTSGTVRGQAPSYNRDTISITVM